MLGLLMLASTAAMAQTGNPPMVTFTAQEDHKNMMEQLGIKALRPGPSGNESAPNHANYDEALANPYPNLPDVLTLKNGKKVTTPEQWWNQRRPEIVEDFEREVIGRVPKNMPKINWQVKLVDKEMVNRIPVIAKQIIGHVDNSAYPQIDVNIEMTLVVPTNVKGPVPVLMMFGMPGLPAPSAPTAAEVTRLNAALKDLLIKSDPSLKTILDEHPAWQPVTLPAVQSAFGLGGGAPGGRPGAPAAPAAGPVDVPGIAGVNNDPSSTQQLLAAGWGYCTISTASIQADNGAGLTRGIIGLVNKGQPRKPEDWGALRAWAWGAGRALDYLEAKEPAVDAKKVGIEGVSRYGKAALIALAFEPKFNMALVGSSGEGGAKLHRRNFGEAVESLTGTGEFHWMAGNFMKYGASDAKFGAKTPGDIPVDSHMLIALCAPRLTFISYGIPEQGDAKWLDQQGSYMATVAAGPVFKLLGKKDLGVSNDYNKEKMPPVNTPMLDGDLAWRQHDQGHQDQANMKWFIKWADQKMGRPAATPAVQAGR
ncbi:hypothetical protein CLV57_0432 [Mucilaginibacter auburnensis]|uniref:4-O-methyl-glucuronoyl methylesterase-like domain-containing protein n=2 Tax=Mucilaginibacter auburnensis TaxID=1457233 RepID=A0A2H9VRK5_9SPHI|nr:hypothetical protein CLV57_0432 [Mucilaginibacter auburnensis]